MRKFSCNYLRNPSKLGSGGVPQYWDGGKKIASRLSEAILVPGAGLEPARLLRTQDFESSASTNSATRALQCGFYKRGIKTGCKGTKKIFIFANYGKGL